MVHTWQLARSVAAVTSADDQGRSNNGFQVARKPPKELADKNGQGS